MGVDCVVIRSRKGMRLVEWKDGGTLRRNWVLPDSIIDEKDDVHITVDSPESGIPFGLPIARMIELKATPEDIERELHRAGIWTAEDVQADVNVTRMALQAAYGVDLAVLLRAVRAYTKSMEVDNGSPL